MFKKIKCRLTELLTAERLRIGGISVFTAVTIIAVTLSESNHNIIPFFAESFCYSSAETTQNEMSAEPMSLKTDSKSAKAVFPVYITCGETTVTIDFTGGTVGDALVLAGFNADIDDFVEPGITTTVSETTYIDYAKIDYTDKTYTEEMTFETSVIYDNKKPEGYLAVTKSGSKGLCESVYTEKTVNGVLNEKVLKETKIIKEPINAVKVVGTKKATSTAVSSSSSVKCISTLTPAFDIKLDENGIPVNYKSKTSVRATAYTYTGNNCSTGVAPQPGYIAVNPKVIPYGTKMYIKSPDGKIIYGYAVAADTGGFIKKHPTGIDLFMVTETQCRNFGVRTMDIYILE